MRCTPSSRNTTRSSGNCASKRGAPGSCPTASITRSSSNPPREGTSMSQLEAAIILKQNRYRPGELLCGEFGVQGERPEKYTIELSVLWHTEGKGDEDLGVVFFQEWERDQAPFDFERPHGFETTLPPAPLSYDGTLVKIHWLVRLRVRWELDGELLVEEPFLLAPALTVTP